MKILQLPHGIAEYLCPVNGLADIYEWKTGERIPEEFLFYARSGIMLLSQNKSIPPKMIALTTSSVGKMQYEFWADIMGYDILSKEGKEYKDTFNDICTLIDRDIPVILFGVDMFHLEYHKKFYHKLHVPGHVILMVGYDEEYIYLYDNAKNDVQKLSIDNLKLAWANDYLSISKKNSYFGINFKAIERNTKNILNRAFNHMSDCFLNPSIETMGKNGINKLIKEFPEWHNEYSKETMKAIYSNFIMFTGSIVPELPKELDENNSGIYNPHKGTRDKFSKALYLYSKRFGEDKWRVAAQNFELSGNIIEKISDSFCKDILKNNFNETYYYVNLFRQLHKTEEQAYLAMRTGL